MLTCLKSCGLGDSYSPAGYMPSVTNCFLAVKGLAMWKRVTRWGGLGGRCRKMSGMRLTRSRVNFSLCPGMVP